MFGFICRQPNGLLCRYNTVTDTITHYNMTDEEYIEMCAEKARQEARDVLEHHLMPYSRVKETFSPDFMTQEEFEKICKKMEE